MPDLGEYANFIWASYAAALLILGGMAVMSIRAHKKSRDAVEAARPKRNRD